jgi:gamma-aminobutyric acid type B receptor
MLMLARIILFALFHHLVSVDSTSILHLFSTDCATNEPQDVLQLAGELLFNGTLQVKQIALDARGMLPENDVVSGNQSFILDGSCSNIFKNLTSLAHISYTPFFKPSGSQATFSIYPSLINFGDYLCVLLQTFTWKELGIITQPEFGVLADHAKQTLTLCGIKTTLIYPNQTLPINRNNIVVYLMLAGLEQSRNIICQAYLEGLAFPNSMFIFLDWYSNNSLVNNGTSLCTELELETFINNALTLQIKPIDNNDTDNDTILENLRALIPNMPRTSFTEYSLEAMLALYTAWKSSKLTGDSIKDELLALDRAGLQGQLELDNNGVRPDSFMNLYQYRDNDYVHVAIIERDQLEFLNNSGMLESVSTVLAEQREIIILPIAITVIFYLIGAIGIIFTTVCLIFNIAYRNTKVMKLASVNLNYLIIIGAYWLYFNTFFLAFPEREKHIKLFEVLFNITYTTTFSFTLCDGTIQGKMFRIFYIFHKPTAKKKNINDWYIVGYVGVLLVIDLIVFLTAVSHPGFRPVAFLIPSAEHAQETNLLGVNTTFFVYVMSSTIIEFSIVHFSLIYGFRILLDLLTALLAFLSCLRVKKKAVNSSKSVITIVYINATITITNFIIFQSTGGFYYPIVIVGCLSLIIIPTNILVLTFIPKMIEVYKDPHATSLFTTSGKEVQPTSSSTAS